MIDKRDQFVSSTARRYISLHFLSSLTGLSQIALDFKYRPHDWATPRDFRFEAGRLWFAEESLQHVSDTLFAAGQPDAAIKLRDWMARHLAETNALTAGSGGQGDQNRVEEASTPAVPARQRKSWMNQWEDEHE